VATEAPPKPRGGWSATLGPDASWRRTVWGEYLSEFIGTFVLIAFGTGVVATAVAGLTQSGRTTHVFDAAGDWLLITFGWGMAVMMGIYVAGGISGAHINPAVTVAFALRRGFPWHKVPGYIIAQVLGALAGAALVYWNFKDAIHQYEVANHITRSGGTGTSGIFTTGPAGWYGDYWGPFVSEFIGTAFLVLLVFAVIDLLNIPPRANLGPVVIGFIVMAIGMSFGSGTGYAINPARDFGPRLLTWFEGWGSAAFPGDYGVLGQYWWVPIVAPIVGGIVGALVYDVIVNFVLKARHQMASPGVEVKGEVVEEEE
jgi:glycerol uptake facilitator protein